MLVSIVIALLGVVSTISASAVLPARQEPPPPPPASPTLYPCTPIWRTATVAETTITVTAAPDTVTIVVVDSASVSAQFSTQGQIDSIQAQQDSLLAPVGEPSSGTPTFIHIASATAYEATEAPGDGTSVYYVPKGPGEPPESYAVATTTVVVLPTQAPPPGPHREINSTIFNTSFRTATATVTGYGVWNTSDAGVGASSGGYGIWNTSAGASINGQDTTLASPEESNVFTATTTTYLATSTEPVPTQATISTVVNGSFMGYGDLPTATSPQPAVLVPRQTCTWVDNEDYGGWCNDWNGETTVRFSSYETTVYPPKTTRHLTPPGPPTSTSAPPAVLPSSTSEPPAVLTVTVTESIPTNTVAPTQPEIINGTEPTQPETTTSDQSVQPEPTVPSTPSEPESTNVTQSAQPEPTNATQPAQPEPVNATQPEHCGQWGPFVIDFDDLPASNTNGPLIFNPFDHFWWGDYWTYAPPPVGPYPPVDGSQLAKCDVSGNNTIAGSPNAGDVPPNGFGAGPRNSSNVYWFNATSAYVGCEIRPTDLNAACDFNVTAWVFDGDNEVPVVTDGFVIPPCSNNTNCHLTEITFPERYIGLTTLNFSATVGGESRAFYMDSLHLGWYNNSCEAGLTRIMSRKEV